MASAGGSTLLSVAAFYQQWDIARQLIDAGLGTNAGFGEGAARRRRARGVLGGVARATGGPRRARP